METKAGLEIAREGNVAIASFPSSCICDVAEIANASALLGEYIEAHPPSRMVFDFSGVTFLSSRVLSLLLETRVHATFDAKGNIVCAFGATVNNAPDAFITVTKATGSYADIHPAGDWAWYVSGTMTIAKVATMSVQQNILAALQKPELLLGAQEQFVMTGWYYRSSQ
jgi:hypothetical protein